MDARRAIPSVERVLATPAASALLARESRALVAEAVARVQARARAALGAGGAPSGAWFDEAWYVAEADAELMNGRALLLRPVINATGVVLHTNLGRAPLAAAALAAIAAVAAGYSNVEYDLEAGARGRRDEPCARLLRRLTGADDALVVNNNAGALVLALNALAAGREVVISRGELIEIGGSFRIPEILVRSGAVLREIGTTNRTHAADYERAITARTGAVLKVHPSNFRVTGFVADVPADALAVLAGGADVPFIYDLGSGLLVEPSRLGLPSVEPTVAQALAAGAGIVTFSGDKLLGGPQAGIVAGRADLIARLRDNPLYRALRVDKLTMAALEATLQLYFDADTAVRELPVLRGLARAPAAIRVSAEALVARLREYGVAAAAVDSEAVVGGGAFPGATLPSVAVALDDPEAVEVERRLRCGASPVLARIERGRVLLDLRAVDDTQLEELAAAVAAAQRRATAAREQSGSPPRAHMQQGGTDAALPG